MLSFSAAAVIALFCGFAFSPIKKKVRDTGIVLLASAGATMFVLLTFICVYASEDFRKMMKPETIAMFRDYTSGFSFIAGIILIGVVAVRTGTRMPNQHLSTTAQAKSGDGETS